jgi:CO/xanthine dehydrogenase FAD-binding subunit
MRSNPAHYQVVAPPSLEAVLALMADAPGIHTPIAGGTELMVALGAGRLATRSLVSIHHLRELRFISADPHAVTIGSGTTFTDLRRSPLIAEQFTLLAQAAGWTGSIANQNRGTLGGNIVNASPAADSPPALLVYDAQVRLISLRGTRTLRYRDFHLGYKKTALAPDELVHSITLPRTSDQWTGYIRKVGTRNAQAISKIALAGLARMAGRHVQEIRIAAASLRETPIRCTATEATLTGRTITPATIADARAALLSEARPIDDIRSSASYRAAVAANLLEEFLEQLI